MKHEFTGYQPDDRGLDTSNPPGNKMAKEMTRYIIKPVPYKFYEDPDGPWVKHEDMLKRNDEAFSEGRKSAQAEPPVECNCQREYEQPTGIYNKGMIFYNAWICPSHGYKRLF